MTRSTICVDIDKHSQIIRRFIYSSKTRKTDLRVVASVSVRDYGLNISLKITSSSLVMVDETSDQLLAAVKAGEPASADLNSIINRFKNSDEIEVKAVIS